MRVLLTGATGMIGRKLAGKLWSDGHEVLGVSRDPDGAEREFPYPIRFISWDQRADSLKDVDIVIHLAGEPVAEGRWTAGRKKSIRDSRVKGTRGLVDAIAALPAGQGPKAVISASAIGFYGDRGDEELGERSAMGAGFLAEVCRDWELEVLKSSKLAERGVRVAAVRIGVVLAREGGALARLTPLFRAGLGGPVGNGSQWMSWIHVDDLVSILARAVSDESMEGVVNAVAPEPVTNAQFTRALGKALGKPAFLPAPRAALRLAFGEMASVVLASQKVRPRVLEELGFEFAHPSIESAFEELFPGGDEAFVAEQWVPHGIGQVFKFFSDARNLEALTPPWLGFRMTAMSTGEIADATLIDYRLRIHGMPVSWRSRIEEWVPGERFVDSQVSGPYSRWHHTHTFEAAQGGTLIRDRVLYRLPLGALGSAMMGGKVRRDVSEIFKFRRSKIRELFR